MINYMSGWRNEKRVKMVNKKREKRLIKGKEEVLIKQLVKCFIYQDSLGKLSKWKNDLYDIFNNVRYLKPFRKLPSYKQLKKWTIDSFEEDLEDRIDNIILYLKLDDYPRIYVTDYDVNKIKELIIEYYKWLIGELSNIENKGFIDIKYLSNEVDLLLDRYEKERE